MGDEHKYGIKTVAIQTGLTQFVIRAWEKRYKAVTPLRTETNRRLYSDADIQRLTLLRWATEAGHGIGQIAELPTEELRTLVGTDDGVAQIPALIGGDDSEETSLRTYIDVCIKAVKQFDAQSLEATLSRSAVAFSQPVLLEKLISPMMQEIGELWRVGALRIAHEHLASAVVRTLLGEIRQRFDTSASMPNLVMATPAGQLHEIGALIAATTAASEGWRVIYLGPNLPAEEIAGCAAHNSAKAVGLSIVYPTDDPHIVNELRKLRRGLRENVSLFIGGSGAIAYDRVINTVGATRIDDMPTFRVELEALRTRQNISDALENLTQ